MKNFILIVLLMVISVTSLDDDNLVNKKHSRQKRAFKFWSIFETLGNMKRIFNEQYDETLGSFNKVYDILLDSFSDTYTTTKAPPTTTSLPSNDSSPMTTTEKYRISRYELGVIANRNLRGLKKLFRIELNDALNQTKYNIRDYQRELKNSVATYATFDDNYINGGFIKKRNINRKRNIKK